MAFIPIPDYVQLIAEYTDGVAIAQNRFFCFGGAPVTEEDLTEIAETFVDVWEEALSGNVNANWSLTTLFLRDMTTESGINLVYTTGLPSAGSNAGESLPTQVSATVTWQTGFVGRSFRGRTYVVGIPRSFVDGTDRQLTEAAQGFLEDRWTTFLTAMQEAGHAPAVVSLSVGGVPRVEGLVTPIFNARVPFPLATQRRRLR